MNLISRLILVFAVASLLIFLGGGIITYRVMKREIDLEQQRFLVERLDQVRRFIERNNPQEAVNRTKLFIVPVSNEEMIKEAVFSDTLVNHSTLDRMEPHLKLEVVEEINESKYRIILYDVIVESDDIVDGVVESLLIIYSILLATVLLIGAISSYYVLRPFRNTLSFIQGFSLANAQSETSLQPTSLPEFRKLNQFLEEMTTQVTREYYALKEFSENASHELKTPLAIIHGKVEQMINDQQVTENQLEQLIAIQKTLKRLNRLSDAMVLLTKIENNEFSKKEDVNLSAIVHQLLEDFQELMELKSVELIAEVAHEVKVESDPTLMEVLVSNLLVNAIKYHDVDKPITIRLTSEYLSVENQAEPLGIAPETLFSRFKKVGSDDQSLGLGLAIVKKICDFSDFSVEYLNISKQHTVKVSLRTA